MRASRSEWWVSCVCCGSCRRGSPARGRQSPVLHGQRGGGVGAGGRLYLNGLQTTGHDRRAGHGSTSGGEWVFRPAALSPHSLFSYYAREMSASQNKIVWPLSWLFLLMLCRWFGWRTDAPVCPKCPPPHDGDSWLTGAFKRSAQTVPLILAVVKEVHTWWASRKALDARLGIQNIASQQMGV